MGSGKEVIFATPALALPLAGCGGVLDPQGPVGASEKLILIDSLAIVIPERIRTLLGRSDHTHSPSMEQGDAVARPSAGTVERLGDDLRYLIGCKSEGAVRDMGIARRRAGYGVTEQSRDRKLREPQLGGCRGIAVAQNVDRDSHQAHAGANTGGNAGAGVGAAQADTPGAPPAVAATITDTRIDLTIDRDRVSFSRGSDGWQILSVAVGH